jgi:nucleoside-diphosphate-sugar epimerase
MKVATPRLLITGESGYIGRRLIELATKRSYEGIALRRTPADNAVRDFLSQLGDEPPREAFEVLRQLFTLLIPGPAIWSMECPS